MFHMHGATSSSDQSFGLKKALTIALVYTSAMVGCAGLIAFSSHQVASLAVPLMLPAPGTAPASVKPALASAEQWPSMEDAAFLPANASKITTGSIEPRRGAARVNVTAQRPLTAKAAPARRAETARNKKPKPAERQAKAPAADKVARR